MRGVKGKIIYGRLGPVKWFLGEKEVTQEEYDAAFPPKEPGVPDGQRPSCWPMTSEALAVHPDQVEVANERARKCGLGVRYEKGTGVCQIDSAGDKAKLVKLEGFNDKQAGYR